jgi:hypothetical protein
MYVITVVCLAEGKYVASVIYVPEAVSVGIANIRFLL